MMKKATVIASLVLSLGHVAANASDWGVATSIGSRHIGQHDYVTCDGSARREFNEVNPGVAVSKRITENSTVEVGAYHNSIYKVSVHANVVYLPIQIGSRVKLGGQAGFVVGYCKPVPMATAVMDVAITKGVGVQAILIPPVPNLTPAVVGLRLRFSF